VPATASGQENISAAIAVDATSVYWGYALMPLAVLKVPLGGGTPTTLASAQGEPTGVVVDSTSVYWTDGTAGTLMKVTPK
jgi:hypothetical protein